MSMIQALALLGHGAEGFVQGRNDAAAQARLQSAEDFAQKQRQFQMSQQQRTLDQQAAVAAAGSPVTATEDPQAPSDSTDMDQPGAAGPVPAPTPTYTVNGKSGMTAAARDAALAAANDPQAIATRQAVALGRTDPVAAAQLSESSARQQSMQIDLANKKFSNDLSSAASKVTAGNWTPLENMLSESGASGEHGAKFIPTADGKSVEAHVVLPDGSVDPTVRGVYPNSPEGALQAAAFLDKGTPPQAKLDHLQAVKAQQEKVAHDQAMETNAAEHNRVLEEGWLGRNQAMQTRADNVGGGRRADHFTDKEWDGVRKVDPETISFPDPTGGKTAPSPELHNVYQQRLTELRLGGAMGPDEAAADARQKTMQVRDLATARVQQAKKDNPDSTLTEQQAVTAIMREAQARAAAAAAARNRPPVAALPVVAPPAVATPTPAAPAAPVVPPAAGMQAAQPTVQAQIAAANAKPAPSNYAQFAAERNAKAAAAASDPDLAALDRARAASIKAGKPMAANAAIAQMNQLRAQRYGL